MESPLNEASCLSTSRDGKERATTEVSLAEQEPQDDSKQNNCNNSSNSNNDNNTPTTTTFEMGDHVYQWVSFMGIPGVYQHHGIVMDVFDDTIRIADFSNNPDTTSKKKSLRNHAGSGQIRLYDVPCAQSTWHKVVYQASWWRRHTSRSGTCTACGSDPPGLVRSRVQFLLDHPTVIPPYNAVHSNCECVALWCKTGTWATLQAASWLACTAASQVKSTLMVSGAAAASQVTVPAAGLWGYLGYTAHVSLLSTQPLLLPAIVGYGVVSAGTPALWLAYARKYWKTTTETLNQSFWDAAIENPEIFVECITYWSSMDGLFSEPNNESMPVTENGATMINAAADDNDIVGNDKREGVRKDGDETLPVPADIQQQKAVAGQQTSGQRSHEDCHS